MITFQIQHHKENNRESKNNYNLFIFPSRAPPWKIFQKLISAPPFFIDLKWFKMKLWENLQIQMKNSHIKRLHFDKLPSSVYLEKIQKIHKQKETYSNRKEKEKVS